MTAHIKMIDTWMIFTMLYPFSVVTLYSLLEFLKTEDENIPIPMKEEEREWVDRRIIKTVTFLLDRGLPIIVTIFIIIFLVLGLHNSSSTVLNKTC